MQIKNLEIKNFKSIDSKLIVPKKLNVLTGPNGAGKSSVLEAVRFLVSADAPENPVKSGCETASVSGDLFGVHLERNVGKRSTVKVDGKTTTQKSVAELWKSTSGSSIDTMKIASSADAVANLTAGSFATWLTTNELLPASIDMETIVTLCSLSKNALDSLSMILPAMPAKFSMEEVDEAYDHFYNERKGIKSDIASKQLVAKWEGPVPTRSAVQVEKELEKFAAFAAEQRAYATLLAAYNQAVAKRQESQKRLTEIEAEIKTRPTVSVDPKEREHLILQQNAAMKEKADITSSINVLDRNITMFERTLSNLDKPVCPISEKLICTTDKTAVKDELTDLLKENNSEKEKLTAQLETANVKLKTIAGKLADWEARNNSASKTQRLYEARKALIEAMPAIPEKPVQPTIPADIEDARKKLLEEKAYAEKYSAALKAQKEIAELNVRLETAEELISVLSPKSGVREEISQIALTPLVEHINKRAESLKSGFRVKLKADNGIHILCTPNEASVEYLPLESVSSGEQATALFLVVDALNLLTGTRLMILDDLDKLDANAFEKLFELLSTTEVQDSYDHIFLAMVNHDDLMKVLDGRSDINVIKMA